MQLIIRTMDTLTILSKNPNGLAISEMSELLCIPVSSVHRILSCLKKEGYVTQDSYTKKYFIGYRILGLSENIINSNSLIISSHSHMKSLKETINKTIVLHVMEAKGSICVDYIPSNDISCFFVKLGTSLPPYASSSGKLFIALKGKDFFEKILGTIPMSSITQKTIDNKEDFLLEIDKIRNNGYSVCDEEFQQGIRSVSAPILDYQGKVIAALTYIEVKCSDDINLEHLQLLKHHADSISKTMGY